MMYDGTEFKSQDYPRRGKSSSGSRLHPYQKTKTWEDNQFWESDTHTEKSKELWRKFLSDMKKEDKIKR